MPAADAPETGSRDEERPRPSRRLLALLLTPIALATVAGTFGGALYPTLLRNHKLLLIALDARNRQLIPVAGRIGFAAFLTVAVLRRLASDPSFYFLGRIYGDDAVAWVERKAGEAGVVVRGIERLFGRISHVLVFLFPGPLVCVLAGATEMRPVVFIVLNIGGTVVTVIVLWMLADVFAGPVGSFTNFVSDNYIWLTGVTIAVTALYVWDQHRRGRRQIPSIEELDDLDEQAEEADDENGVT
jgi:membrane protein DedA with SNARE-associated domain